MQWEVPGWSQVNDPRHDQLEMLLSLHVAPGPLGLAEYSLCFWCLEKALTVAMIKCEKLRSPRDSTSMLEMRSSYPFQKKNETVSHPVRA